MLPPVTSGLDIDAGSTTRLPDLGKRSAPLPDDERDVFHTLPSLYRHSDRRCRIVYEDFAASYEDTVQRATQHVGVHPTVMALPPPRMREQSSELSKNLPNDTGAPLPISPTAQYLRGLVIESSHSDLDSAARRQPAVGLLWNG